jgi:hypothetical protein
MTAPPPRNGNVIPFPDKRRRKPKAPVYPLVPHASMGLPHQPGLALSLGDLKRALQGAYGRRATEIYGVTFPGSEP